MAWSDFLDISIHAPPRGATYRLLIVSAGTKISIHAPPRGATQGVPKYIVKFLFQFTPLREGRHTVFPNLRYQNYFNSRPSARGDMMPVRCLISAPISIHAPPRGATRKGVHVVGVQQISIHAPPRGATDNGK